MGAKPPPVASSRLMPAFRNPLFVFLAVPLFLASAPALRASPGVAVVIDKDALALVGAGRYGCPDSSVAFVNRGGVVRAICDAPPPPVEARVAPPPEPVWSIAAGESIEGAFRSWLPEGWRLAWDAEETPVAATEFKHVGGEPMRAIAEAFDRRSLWGSQPLIACVFPSEQILQVRSSGACGTP